MDQNVPRPRGRGTWRGGKTRLPVGALEWTPAGDRRGLAEQWVQQVGDFCAVDGETEALADGPDRQFVGGSTGSNCLGADPGGELGPVVRFPASNGNLPTVVDPEDVEPANL